MCLPLVIELWKDGEKVSPEKMVNPSSMPSSAHFFLTLDSKVANLVTSMFSSFPLIWEGLLILQMSTSYVHQYLALLVRNLVYVVEMRNLEYALATLGWGDRFCHCALRTIP